jgi:hypothetical protein
MIKEGGERAYLFWCLCRSNTVELECFFIGGYEMGRFKKNMNVEKGALRRRRGCK